MVDFDSTALDYLGRVPSTADPDFHVICWLMAQNGLMWSGYSWTRIFPAIVHDFQRKWEASSGFDIGKMDIELAHCRNCGIEKVCAALFITAYGEFIDEHFCADCLDILSSRVRNARLA